MFYQGVYRNVVLDWTCRSKNQSNGSSNSKGTKKKQEEEKTPLIDKYCAEWKENDKRKGSYKIFPRFYRRISEEDDISSQKLREKCKAISLQKKDKLSNIEELETLLFLLKNHQSLPMFGGNLMIDYENFMKVGERAGPKYKQFFKASCFAKMQCNDPYGRIPLVLFYNYILKKAWLQQSWVELSMYDTIGQGYLRESDLEKYIEELIPTLPQLNGLDENFKLIYICTVSRKFFFFLDPLRTGRIKILDILASGFLEEMFQLKDEDLSEERQASNWFSFNSMMKLFVQYLDLDKDCNGTLSRDELSHYGMGSLTDVFLDRVFQECLTSNGEMDYKTYLDFVLAMTSGDNPTALHYIFRLLDIEKKGSLNAFTLNYLFKGIQEKLSERGWEQISFLDVKDEVFDMINPKDPYRITYKDLVNSGEGNTFIGIFIDVFAFRAYDNR